MGVSETGFRVEFQNVKISKIGFILHEIFRLEIQIKQERVALQERKETVFLQEIASFR